MSVTLNGHVYDITQFQGYGYLGTNVDTGLIQFPNSIFSDMLAELAAAATILAGGLAPGAAGGYARSNGAAWVRVSGIAAADVNAGTFGAGDFTFPGSVILSTAVGKIIPGATSLSLRNNADSADNIIITNAGAVTFRAGLSGITTLAMTGALTGVTTIAASSTITAGAAQFFIHSGRSKTGSTANGLIELLNNAGSDFTRLNFGGSTSSFPAIAKASGTVLAFTLADATGAVTIRTGAGSGATLGAGSIDVLTDVGITSTNGIVVGSTRVVAFTTSTTTFVTSLAINGGSIAITGSAATALAAFVVSGTTTAQNYSNWTNTGGDMKVGVNNNGGGVITGGTAYSGLIYTSTATPVEIGVNGIAVAKFDAAAVTITGAILNVNAPTGAVGVTSTTGTQQVYLNLNNTGGTYYFGVDNSTHSLFGAATAYAVVIVTPGGIAMEISKTTNLVALKAYGAGTATFDASGNITSVSDERQKTLIRPYSAGLAELRKVRPIVYRFHTDSGLDTEHDYTGFSAQNVQTVMPENVFAHHNSGTLSLWERGILAASVNAIQELATKHDTLDTRVRKLEAAA